MDALHILFVICVLIGFVFQWLATLPNVPYAARIAWGFWLVAAVLWAVPQLGFH